MKVHLHSGQSFSGFSPEEVLGNSIYSGIAATATDINQCIFSSGSVSGCIIAAARPDYQQTDIDMYIICSKGNYHIAHMQSDTGARLDNTVFLAAPLYHMNHALDQTPYSGWDISDD